jgi:hypothetical protein
MKIKHALSLLFCLLSSAAIADHTTVGLQANIKGPNTTSSAQLMDVGTTGFSLQYQHIGFKSISDADFEHAAEHGESLHGTDTISSTALNFTWGFSDRLTFGVSVPRIARNGMVEAAHHDAASHVEGEEVLAEEAEIVEFLGSSKGIGDTRVFANFQLWSGSESSGSLLFGVKAPTGEDAETSLYGHRLESELQPGSGSWDSLIGAAYSRELGSWRVDGNVLYSFVTEGSQNTDLGDTFNYNLAFSHPLPEISLAGSQTWSLNFLFEINGERRDQVEISGFIEKNSGGNIVYFAPGLSLSNDTWFVSASLSKAMENFKGIQSEPNTRFLFNFGRSF